MDIRRTVYRKKLCKAHFCHSRAIWEGFCKAHYEATKTLLDECFTLDCHNRIAQSKKNICTACYDILFILANRLSPFQIPDANAESTVNARSLFQDILAYNDNETQK